MYDRAFIDRFEKGLQHSEQFGDLPDLQKQLVDLCVDACFICADPHTVEGRSNIVEDFILSSQMLFKERLLAVPAPVPSGDAPIDQLNRLHTENELLKEESRYWSMLNLFLDNVRQEGKGETPPVSDTLKIG